jgi:hypothetical protein
MTATLPPPVDTDLPPCALGIAPEELEALEAPDSGGLSVDEVRRLSAHVAECAACSAELAWQRAELELMTRRTRVEEAPDLDRLWAEVERRVSARSTATPAKQAPPSRASRRRRAFTHVATAGAAAAFVLAVWRGSPLLVPPVPLLSSPSPSLTQSKPAARDPLATVRGAERQYAEAAAELERRWAAERARLDPTTLARVEADLARSRAELDAARRQAGDDVDARFELLSTYADYVYSLHALIVDLDSEVN